MKRCSKLPIEFLLTLCFGTIGDYSRPLVDRYCRLWSTQANVMTSLRLHLKVVSLNHFKVNIVSFESIRTPGGVYGVSKVFMCVSCLVFCNICHDILVFMKIFRLSHKIFRQIQRVSCKFEVFG